MNFWLQNLDNIEEDLVESLSAAGQALKELSKDKSNVKSVEAFTNSFMSRLDRAGSGLSQQIAYLTQVTTGVPYCEKDSKMPKSRLEHVRTRLNQLEDSNKEISQ